MEQDYKKWLRRTIVGILGIMIFVVLLQIIVDPYFHYHKPITKYRLNDERYINDGIARHFDYDAIIIGNSLCQNFSTFQYDELFGTNSVKLPYSGAGYKEIWESLGRALEYNDGVKEVLVCMDLQDLDREAEWERYEGNPTYLYDDNVFNDIKYIFNKDAIYRGTLYNLIWTVTGHENTSMDEYSTWERETGAEIACSYLTPVTDDMVADSQVFDEEDKDRETKNLTQNVIKVIERDKITEDNSYKLRKKDKLLPIMLAIAIYIKDNPNYADKIFNAWSQEFIDASNNSSLKTLSKNIQLILDNVKQ